MHKVAVTIVLSLSLWALCLVAAVSAQTTGCEDTIPCEPGMGEQQKPQLSQKDTSPPRLVSIDVEPEVIDTTSAEQMITITIVVTDDQFVVWPGFSFREEAWKPWSIIPSESGSSIRDLGRDETEAGVRF